MRIIEDYYKVIQRQIKEAIRSPIQIHQDDEKRVEKIFCDILEKNIHYGVDDVYVIIDALEPEFSRYTKNRNCALQVTFTFQKNQKDD